MGGNKKLAECGAFGILFFFALNMKIQNRKHATNARLSLCLQLQKDECATRCALIQVAGAPDPTSVSPAGTTAVRAHVWTAVTLNRGQ